MLGTARPPGDRLRPAHGARPRLAADVLAVARATRGPSTTRCSTTSPSPSATAPRSRWRSARATRTRPPTRLLDRGRRAGDGEEGRRGRPVATRARDDDRRTRTGSRWSAASAPATRFGGALVHGLLRGLGPGAHRRSTPTPPARSSRPGWPAPTPCPPWPSSTGLVASATDAASAVSDASITDEQSARAAAHPSPRPGRRGRRPTPAAAGPPACSTTAARSSSSPPTTRPAARWRSGGDPMAMADRRSLLDRLVEALADPDVDGVLGTPDIVEELLLLGALEDKVVIGSMNRGGLDGATWTMDDRFTGYDAASIAALPARGRQDAAPHRRRATPARCPTIEALRQAVSELADHGLMAMVEPLPYQRDDRRHAAAAPGRAVAGPGRRRSPRRSGTTSAYTWLKMPACDDPETVFAATTLPCVVLGGVPSPDPADDLASWGRALRQPAVRGLVVGRALLYPPDGDVAGGGRRRRRGARSAASGPALSMTRAAGAARGERPRADLVALTPADAGLGRGPACRSSRCRPGCRARSRTGRVRGLRAAAAAGQPVSRSRRREPGRRRGALRARPVALGLQPGHRLRLRRSRQRRHPARATAGRGGAAVAPAASSRSPARRTAPAEDVPVEVRGAGPATRQVKQLRRARRLGPRREADLLRADHPAGQLVELPAAQARRRPTRARS